MKIGLALGSGAARGFAFAPMVQKLIDEGVKIDMVAGSSIGAASAAFLGLHNSGEDIVKLAKGLNTAQVFLKLVDLAYPGNSILRGKKIKRVLKKEFFGEKTFADCSPKVIIVGTSLKTKKAVYFEKGSIVEAIMSSIGLPGALPPYNYQNDWFIDGGIVDPVPIQVLLDRGCDKVIAIDILETDEAIPKKTYTVAAHAFCMLLEQQVVNPNPKKVFLLKPMFNSPFADAYQFHKWKKFYDPGKKEIEKMWPKLKKWLNHSR
jgi:NTE family protein